MSVAAGAPQPPNRPSQSAKPGNYVYDSDNENRLPILPEWEKNEKIKTCKCEACGDRVRYFSYRCKTCYRHVCSECLDPASSKSRPYQKVARSHVKVGCWHRYRSNRPPGFPVAKQPPPRRTEEERKAKEAKARAAQTRALRQAASIGHGAESSKVIEESPSPDSAGDMAPDDPDEDYEGPSTVGNGKRRRGIKRKMYIDYDSDDDVFDDMIKNDPKKSKKRARSGEIDGPQRNNEQSRNTANPQETSSSSTFGKANEISSLLSHPNINQDTATTRGPTSHLARARSIVVGAGFIGLFIARKLALEVQKAGIEHHITVIDIRSQPCELASGSCNGFLTFADIPEEWSHVTELAKPAWEELLSDVNICEQLSVSTKNLLCAEDVNGADPVASPSWFHANHGGRSTTKDVHSLCRIQSQQLASWLFEQCKALKVDFRFNSFVSAARHTQGSKLSNVVIRSTDPKHEPVETLECSNLILAAGPYTTDIFFKLFKKASVDLRNYVRPAHWFQFATGNISERNEVAVRLVDAAQAEPEWQDEITIIPCPDAGVVTVSGFRSAVQNISLGPHEAISALKPKTSRLRDIVAKYLTDDGSVGSYRKEQLKGKGRSETSVAKGGAPGIQKVPVSMLGFASEDESEEGRRGGVWLCYGFGRFGTSLAPGAARDLVLQMLNGDSSSEINGNDGDDVDSGAPGNVKAPIKWKGKGKAL